MNLKESFLSPTAIYFTIERESCWRYNLRSSSIQCHNNPVLVPPHKTRNPVKDIYDGHTDNLEKRVNIWKSMDVVPVEYGTFTQKFHLTMWLFQFITVISFKGDYMIWRSIVLLV